MTKTSQCISCNNQFEITDEEECDVEYSKMLLRSQLREYHVCE